MKNRKAAGFRKASRLIGYGGLLGVAVAAMIGYIVRVKIHKNPLGYYWLIEGKIGFPQGKAPMAMAIAAVAIIVLAIILRIVSAVNGGKRPKETVDFLNAKEAEENDADDSAYFEESLAPMIDAATTPAAIAAPAEGSVSVSETPAAPADKVIASFEVRVPTDPAKESKRAEKKARRTEKTSKVKASIGKKVNKVFPSEKRENLKKKVKSVKRAAKVIIPVAVACVAVATVAKKRKMKKREKEKARNRKQFYQWLG